MRISGLPAIIATAVIFLALSFIDFPWQFGSTVTVGIGVTSGFAAAAVYTWGLSAGIGVAIGSFTAFLIALFHYTDIPESRLMGLPICAGVALGDALAPMILVPLIQRLRRRYGATPHLFLPLCLAVFGSSFLGAGAVALSSIPAYLPLPFDPQDIFALSMVKIFGGTVIYAPLATIILGGWGFDKPVQWRSSLLTAVALAALAWLAFNIVPWPPILDNEFLLFFPILLFLALYSPVQGACLNIVILATVAMIDRDLAETFSLHHRITELGKVQATVTMMALTIFGLRFMLDQIQHLENTKAELARTRIVSLNQQMNPHFLFNSLNALVEHIATDPKRAEHNTIKIASFLRRSLLASQKETHTIGEELELSRLYVDLETHRKTEIKVAWQVDCQPDIQVPVVLLQPILENAIRYGDPTTISVKVAQNPDQLIIVVRNETLASLKQHVKKGSGSALANIHMRMRLIFGPDAQLKTEETAQSFVAEMAIPLKGSQV